MAKDYQIPALERQKALATGNFLRYYQICRDQGLEHELPDYFEIGEAEGIYAQIQRRNQMQPKIGQRKRAVSDGSYRVFLKESQGIETPDVMRRVLALHFQRFSSTGKQPVFGMDDTKVKKLWHNILSYAKKR